MLRVEDEGIDAAELLRVTVNKSTAGRGRKRRTSFVCTGTLHRTKTTAWADMRVRSRRR